MKDLLRGVTFDQQSMTSSDFAHFQKVFLNNIDGVTRGCEVTKQGMSVFIAPGYFFVSGRLVQVTSSEEISLSQFSSETIYATIVFTVDMTKPNTSEKFNQGSFDVLTSTTGYPELTQEDLEDGGTVYQMEFARVRIFGGIITNLTTTYKKLNAVGFATADQMETANANIAGNTDNIEIITGLVNDIAENGVNYAKQAGTANTANSASNCTGNANTADYAVRAGTANTANSSTTATTSSNANNADTVCGVAISVGTTAINEGDALASGTLYIQISS